MKDGISELDQRFLNLFDVTKINDGLKEKVINVGFKLDCNQILEEHCSKFEKIMQKFTLKLQFKVTIPIDYQQDSQLNIFRQNYENKFYFFHQLLTDEKCGQVSHRLIPGKTYLIKIWFINKGMRASSQEILGLLKANNCYLTGAQGASILFQEKGYELQEDKYYVSFDEKDNLPSANGSTLVPDIGCNSDGGFGFNFDNFENDRDVHYGVIGFCDCEDLVA